MNDFILLFLSAFGQATVDGAINFSAASAADIAGAGGSAAAAYLQPLVAAATAAGTASTTGAAEAGGGGLFLPGPAAAGIGPDGLPCQPDLPGNQTVKSLNALLILGQMESSY